MPNRGKADFGTMGDFLSGDVFKENLPSTPHNLNMGTNIPGMNKRDKIENIEEFDPIRPVNKGFEIEEKSILSKIGSFFKRTPTQGTLRDAGIITGTQKIKAPPKPKSPVNQVDPSKVHLAGESEQANLFQTKPKPPTPEAPKPAAGTKPVEPVEPTEPKKRDKLAGVGGLATASGIGGYWMGGGAGESATTKLASAPLKDIKMKGVLSEAESIIPKLVKSAKKANKVQKLVDGEK